MSKDKIIDLSTKMRLEPRKGKRGCLCGSVYVCEHTRMLECQTCGKVIDPFDFMLKEARSQQNAVWGIKNLRNEHEKLDLAVSQLKKDKNNLNQQVRRLKNKRGKLEDQS